VSRREIALRVDACPYCAARHSYVIEATLRPVPGASEQIARTRVLVACAVDGRAFLTQADVPVGAGQQFLRAEFARYAATSD
jgi:hypothetical protein